ncbi:hypothetical protein BDW22DRAFT_1312290, partial [Trametopsis cervina]
HTSLLDFLTDPRRSGDYYVEPYRENGPLAQASLQTIIDGLQFNICHIESSYVANKDIPNLAEQIKTHISPALSYAYRFWDYHVCKCEDAVVIKSDVCRFFDHSVLAWLEAMSLLGMVNTIVVRMRHLREW